MPETTTDATPRSEDALVAEQVGARFAAVVRDIAAQLRDLADRVERHTSPSTSLRTGRPDFAYPSSRVLHEVTTGLANLGLDRLPSLAADAERTAAYLVAGGLDAGS